MFQFDFLYGEVKPGGEDAIEQGGDGVVVSETIVAAVGHEGNSGGEPGFEVVTEGHTDAEKTSTVLARGYSRGRGRVGVEVGLRKGEISFREGTLLLK